MTALHVTEVDGLPMAMTAVEEVHGAEGKARCARDAWKGGVRPVLRELTLRAQRRHLAALPGDE